MSNNFHNREEEKPSKKKFFLSHEARMLLNSANIETSTPNPREEWISKNSDFSSKLFVLKTFGLENENKINGMDALDIKINSISAKKGVKRRTNKFNRNGLSINSRCCVNRFSLCFHKKGLKFSIFCAFAFQSLID